MSTLRWALSRGRSREHQTEGGHCGRVKGVVVVIVKGERKGVVLA